jgi:hypothetical protein
MSDVLKFFIVGVVVFGLHYILWYKIYRKWFGHFLGLRKVLLFIACIVLEFIVAVLLLMLGLNQ